MSNPIAYTQWFSEVHTRFGAITSTVQRLGFFSITHSFGFRALLALLAGCLLLRLIENIDLLRRNREMRTPEGDWRTLAEVHPPTAIKSLPSWRYRTLSASSLFQADHWPWAEISSLLIQGGGLMLLAGLLITHLWGWQVTGLIVQGGNRTTVRDKWVALDPEARQATHSPHIITFVEEQTSGLKVKVIDETERPLSLQQTAEADPVTQLTMSLTEDQYFAIPEAQLVIRLTPQPGIAAPNAALVQAYRSPPGRLIFEAIARGDTELAVDDVTLILTDAPYARLTITSNPGLWPTGVGLIFLIGGLMGRAIWPQRRFWLREKEQVEGVGKLPPTLTREEND